MLSNEIDRINNGGLLQRTRVRRRPDPEPEPEMSILPYYGDETNLSKPLRPHEEHKIVKHIKELGGFKTSKMIAQRKMHGAGFMDFIKDIAGSAAGKFVKVALSTIITLFTGIPAETIIETLTPFIEELGTDILGFVVKNANKGFQWIVDKLQEKKDIKDGKKKKKKTKKTKKKKAGLGLKMLNPDHPLYNRLMNEYIPLDEVINRNKKKLGSGFNEKFMDGLLWFTHDLVKPIVSHIPIIGTAVGAAVGDIPKYIAERMPGSYEYHNPFEKEPDQPYVRPPDVKREGVEKAITQSQLMKGRGRRTGGKIFDPSKGFWSNHLAPLATIAKDIALDYAGQELAAAWRGEKPVYQQLKDEFNRRSVPQRPQGPPRSGIEMETLRPVAAAADAARAVRASAVQDEFKQVEDAQSALRRLRPQNPFLEGAQPFVPGGRSRFEPALLSHGEEMKVSRSSNIPQGYQGPSHELGLPPKVPRQPLSTVLSALERQTPAKHPEFKHKLGIFNPRESDRPITSQTFEPDAPHISQSNLFQQSNRPVYEPKEPYFQPTEKKEAYKSPIEQSLVRARTLSREDPNPFKLTQSSKDVPKAVPITRETNLNLKTGQTRVQGQTKKSEKIRTPSLSLSSASSGDEFVFQPQTPPTVSRSLVPPPPKVVPIFQPKPPQTGPTFVQRLAQGPIGQAASAAAAPFITPIISSSLDKAISQSMQASKEARMAQMDKEFNERAAQRRAEKAKAAKKKGQGKYKKSMKRKTGKGKKRIYK